MNCERCNENEVSVIVNAVVNGKLQKLKLCESCAQKIGYSIEKTPSKSTLIEYTRELVDDIIGSKNIICPWCKTDYKSFRKNFKLNCPHCYITFGDFIYKIVEVMQKKEIKNNISYKYDIEQLINKNRKCETSKLYRKLKIYTDFNDIEMSKKTLYKIKKEKEK